MEAKVKCERVLVLCHGCLSAERKISYITGHQKTLFTKLRGDERIENDKDLLLCWECKALLNKTQQFQARIKSAQKQLADYLNDYMHDKIKFNTHTQLTKIKNLKYDYTYTYEEDINENNVLSTQYEIDMKLDTTEHLHLHEEENSIEVNGELLQEIKEEFNNTIEDEVESLNNCDNYDDIDFCDTEREDDPLQKKENIDINYDTESELEKNLLQRRVKKKKKVNGSGVCTTESEIDKEDGFLQKKERRKGKNNVSDSYDDTKNEMDKEDDLLQKKERRKRKNNVSDSCDDTISEMDKEDDLLQKKERRKRKNNVSDSCDDTISEMDKEDDLLQKKERRKRKNNVSDSYDDTKSEMDKEDDLLQKKERRKRKNNVSDSCDDTISEMDKEDDLLQKKERRKRKNNVSDSCDDTISEMDKEDDLLQKKERRKRKNNVSDSYDDTKSEMDKEDDLLQKKERRKRKNNVSDKYDDTINEMDKEDDFLQKKEKKKNISVSGGDDTESEFEKEDEQKEIKRKKQQNTSRRQYATSRVIHKTFMGKLEQFYDNVNIDFPDIENIKSLDKPKYKCKTCQVAYRRYLDYVRHNIFKHTELKYPTPCNICKDNITSTAHLHAHWKLRHNVMMKCKFCGDICRSMGELKKHLNRTHTKIYTCDKCAQEFPTLKEFSEHHQKVHEFFECDYCQAKYRSKTGLEKHIKNTHVPYQCTVCKKTFRNFRIFVGTHVKYHHPELLDKLNIRSKIKPTSKELRYCVECDKQFASIHLYKRHIEHSVKHTWRPLEDTLKEFSEHHQKVHEFFECDYCQAKYRSKTALEKHIKNTHVPYQCTVCKKTFRNFRIFVGTHVKYHHPELLDKLNIRSKIKPTSKELRYCVECDKQFASIHLYKRHIEHSVKHKRRPLEDITCPACKKVFHSKLYRNNHYELFHTNKTKYYCEICNKYFARGLGLKNHLKHVHQKIPQLKNKFCNICGRGFSTNRILVNHRRTHTGERPHKCQYCPAAFAQKTAMMTHQKTQHKSVISSSSHQTQDAPCLT